MRRQYLEYFILYWIVLGLICPGGGHFKEIFAKMYSSRISIGKIGKG